MTKTISHRSIKGLLACMLLAISLLMSLGELKAQICPPGPYEVGTSPTQLPCTHCQSYNWGIVSRHDYFNGSVGLNYGNTIGFGNTHYHDQWLDLYVPSDSLSGPFPVFVFSHAGGQEAGDAYSNAKSFAENNIAFISWESAQSSSLQGGSYYENDSNLPLTVSDFWTYTHDDFQLTLDWLWANAATYNLDLSRVFVGGSSRGSRSSFQGLDNPNHPIKGVFMTQAFPDGEWFLVEIAGEESCTLPNIEDYIGPNYPPMALRYKGHIADVIDAHDPLNAMALQELYNCYDIPSQISHSLGSSYAWSNDAIQFIQNIDTYFNNSPQLVDGQIVDSSANILLAPSLNLSWNPNDEKKLRLEWTGNSWTQNMLESPYVNKETEVMVCEFRLGRLATLSDTMFANECNISEWNSSYSFNTTNENETYSFPENAYINTCIDPTEGPGEYTWLQENDSYGVQARCNLSPSSNYYEIRTHRFWTEWTDIVSFEGRCRDFTKIIDSLTPISVSPSDEGPQIVPFGKQ